MVQISLLIKLFLLVFTTAVIKLIQVETELWSKSLCIVLQPAEMLLIENKDIPHNFSENYNWQVWFLKTALEMVGKITVK